MSPETSAAAVAVPANTSPGLPPFAAATAVEFLRVPANDGTTTSPRAGLGRSARRLASALGDIVGLLAIAYAFALVILAVGIPIALLVRLVMSILHAL